MFKYPISKKEAEWNSVILDEVHKESGVGKEAEVQEEVKMQL